MKELLADWKFVLAMGGAAIAAIAMIAYAFFRPALNPEEEERKRRLHLNQIGRIAEGQIVELVERPPESGEVRKGLFGASAKPLKDMRPRHLVSYSYLISGVTYQTAQDITGLESQVRLERLVAGIAGPALIALTATYRLLHSAFPPVALSFSLPVQGGSIRVP